MQETTQVVKAVINGKLPCYEYKSQEEKKWLGEHRHKNNHTETYRQRPHAHEKEHKEMKTANHGLEKTLNSQSLREMLNQ